MIGFHDPSRRGPAVLAALLLCACPAEDPPVTADGSSGSDTEPASDSTTQGPSDTTLDGTTVEPSTGGEELCGNGMIDEGEGCDDGNTASGDGCSAECQPEACGMVWSWSEPIAEGDPGANDTTVDAMGNVYVVGDMVGGADNDIWVAKWGPDGTQAWSRTIDSGNGIDVGLGIEVDDAGDAYIAARVTGDADAMYYARLASADGSTEWEQTIDSMFMGEDDLGIDTSFMPNGDLVVVGRLRVGDGDDDLWLSRRSAADGSEIWATTWSGMGDGTFSTDRISEVDVGPDGNIWVAVREHVAFDTQEAVLLGFDGDGNLTTTYAPLVDGLDHEDNPIGLAAYEGGAYFAVWRSSAVATYLAWMYKVDAAGAEQWSITQDDWASTAGEDYRLRSLEARPDGTIMLGGDFLMGGGPSDHEWREAWIAQLDPGGAEICRGGHMEDDGAAFAPVLFVYSGGAAASGGMALSGRADEGAGVDSWLWTGYFAF